MSSTAACMATKAISRRQFSILSSLRSMARGMEAHPFERLPSTQKSARADWGKLFKQTGTQAAIFFPGIALILGWPLLAKRVFDGRIGTL